MENTCDFSDDNLALSDGLVEDITYAILRNHIKYVKGIHWINHVGNVFLLKIHVFAHFDIKYLIFCF
jgi:hypothetical protein